MGIATEPLVQEHDRILSMLAVLKNVCRRRREGIAVPEEDLDLLLKFFEIFVGELHHAKEEEVLIPALLEKGYPLPGGPRCGYYMELHLAEPGLSTEFGEIDRLLQSEGVGMATPGKEELAVDPPLPVLEEHRLGHRLLKAMRAAIGRKVFGDLASRFADLLEGHIEKENSCLFPMTDDSVGERRQKELVSQYSKIDQRVRSSPEWQTLEREWSRLRETRQN